MMSGRPLWAVLSFFAIIFPPSTCSLAQSSPVISSIGTPVASADGVVYVYGSSFGLNAGTVTFNGVPGTISSWSDTLVAAITPSGATTGDLVLSTADGSPASGGVLVITGAPTVSTITPTRGNPGALVTINGMNFGPSPGTENGVSFQSGTSLFWGSIATWSDSQIRVTIPAQAVTGNVCVSIALLTGCSQLDIGPPQVSFIDTNSGAVGTSFGIDGSAFGTQQGTITFNGVAGSIVYWSDWFVYVTVPAGASTGPLVLTSADGFTANGGTFTVTAGPPVITALNPAQGRTGDMLTISGSNFGPTQGTGWIELSTPTSWVQWPVTSWTDTQITVSIPPLAKTGSLQVIAAAQFSNSVGFTALPPLDAGRGPIEGQILDSAGNPFGNAEVALSGPNVDSVPHVMSDINGRYAFLNVSTGPFWVQATSDGIYFATGSGNLADLNTPVEVNLRFPGTGALEGTISFADGTPAAYVFPTFQNLGSLGPFGSYFNFDHMTDASGHFSIASVPSGSVLVSVSDDMVNNNAVQQQVQLASGETKTINLTIDGSAYSFKDPYANAENLGGADGFRYDIDCSGNVKFGGRTDGSSTAFDSWFGGGAEVLSLNGRESATTFPCVFSAVQASAQQLSFAPVQIEGVAVSRKVFIPASGGFARYLEILSNPGSQPVSEDVVIRTQSADGQVGAVAVDPSSTSNTYAVTDSATPASYGVTVSEVLGGPNAPVPISGSHFVTGDPLTYYDWNVTVPAGGTVALMHFLVQRPDGDVGDAQAQALELVNLSDPDALTGLTAQELSSIVNFRFSPPPVITMISPDAGIANTSVTILGSNFGATPSNGAVTFNGLAAATTFWSDTRIVATAPSAVHSGPVTVTTMGGASNAIQFTFAPGIRFSLQSVYVTPDEANLEVGAATTFTLSDASGAAVADATWSVDSTLATISSDPSNASNATLQALAPGEVTITATSSLGTAQAKAMIYGLGATPPGTAAWGFYPQTQDNYVAAAPKSRRINPDAPYLYVAEGTDDSPRLSALDDSGHLKWRLTLNPITATNTIIFPVVAAGTNDGGVLVETNEADPNSPNEATAFYRFGPDGKSLWTYSVPTVDTSGFAIAPDNTIYFWQEPFPDILLMALDDSSGTAKPIFSPSGGTPPVVTSSEQPGPSNPDGTTVTESNPWKPCADFFAPGRFDISLPSSAGEFTFQPIIGADGSVYVLQTGESTNYNYDQCDIEKIGNDPVTNATDYIITTLSGQLQYTRTLQLVRLNANGPTATTQVGSVSYSGKAGYSGNGPFAALAPWSFNNGNAQLPTIDFDTVTPNAEGGAVVPWGERSSLLGDTVHVLLTNILNDAPVSTNELPFETNGGFNGFGNTATNDRGTLFFDFLGRSVSAVDISTGTPKWSLPGSLVAATDDGGAIIQNGGSLFYADESGNPGSDNLPIGSGVSYIAEGMFLQNGPAGSIQGIPTNSDQLTKLLAVPWSVPVFSNPQQNFKAKGEKITQLSQTDLPAGQTEGCTGFDSVGVDLPAIMAPASGINPSTNTAVPESGNTFNYRASKGIDEKLIPDDPNLVTLSVDDPLNPDKLSAIVRGDGVSHQVTLRGHGNVNPPKGVIVRAFDAKSNAFKGAVFQGIVSPYRFWQVHEFEIGDAADNTTPGSTPSAPTLAAELNRIFKPQANIEFGVIDRGLVNSFHWDKNGDHEMHFGSTWDPPNFNDNNEAGPLHNYIVQTIDGTTSPLLTQGWTMYLYYLRNFDNSTTEGFTVQGIRSIPSFVKTQYNLQINELQFISNLTAHEIGHKLGLGHPKGDDRFRLMNTFNPGNAGNKAQNTPCKLVLKEWQTANH